MKKNGLIGTASLIVLGLSLFAPSARCEGPSNSSAPNPKSGTPAPPSPQNTCTLKNGKPCPGWVRKMIGQYPIPAHTETPNLYHMIRDLFPRHQPPKP